MANSPLGTTTPTGTQRAATPTPESKEVASLRWTLRNMSELAFGGLEQIAAIARIAQHCLETMEKDMIHVNIRDVAMALATINDLALETKENVYSETESAIGVSCKSLVKTIAGV